MFFILCKIKEKENEKDWFFQSFSLVHLVHFEIIPMKWAVFLNAELFQIVQINEVALVGHTFPDTTSGVRR